MLPVGVYIIRGGDTPVDLTGLLDGQPRFATAAVGGFADASFTLRGDQRRKVPYLALVRIMLGADVLYEGQVEDAEPSGAAGELQTTVTCFGLRNLLAETSVRRIWSKRDLDWQEVGGGLGSDLGTGVSKGSVDVSAGHFDPSDLSKIGVQLQGNGVAVAPVAGNAAEVAVPQASVYRVMCDYVQVSPVGMNSQIQVHQTPSGAWGSTAGPGAGTVSGSIDSGGWTGGDRVRVIFDNATAGSLTPTQADRVQFTNFRILGSTVVEDAAGGFYGGTILRDLIGLVPGLTVGVIEAGSDFTIETIERGVRSAALSVIQEVASYYTREWAVWEDGRVDWKTRQLDQPDWLVTTADCAGLSIKGSLDGIARTVYVLYTDAASGLDAEASSTATAQRNPYVKQGRNNDVLVSPGFPMTTNTATQLATRIAGDIGRWVPVQGSISLPATKLIQRALGAAGPAALIRAGDNIAIADLPKTDLFAQGRDGETLFHIIGTDCDLKAGTVTLQLEGQASRVDVLLSRLAAVTRTLTG